MPPTSVFFRKKKAGKGQSALYLLLRPGFRSERREAGARCSESWSIRDVTLRSWPHWTLSLWKAPESLLYDHGTHGEWEAMGGELFEGPVSMHAVRSLQVRFNFLIQTADHIERLSPNNCFSWGMHFFLCTYHKNTSRHQKDTFNSATTPGTYRSLRWTFSTCGDLVFFFFIPVQFQRKTASVFEQAKTSGCTLANHVISERIYPNKGRSNTIPLWLLNGFCIIHLDPYNNTGEPQDYFQISQISLQGYNT